MKFSPVSEFEIAARIDAEYALRGEKWEAARRVDERIETVRKSTEQQSDEMQTLLLARIVSAVSPREYQQLTERLGTHQEALIEALQENREALDASDARLEMMLGQAYVLEDGRRVFKTEDGLRVFDEHGRQVGDSEIDPDRIDDWRPRAETYLQERDQNISLRQTQEQLHDYQSRLDSAQSRLDEGNLSRAEYDELNDLMMHAPSAVRAKLPSADPAYQRQSSIGGQATTFDLEGLEVDGPTTSRFGFN